MKKKLTKTGNSDALLIPTYMMRELGWKAKQEITVEMDLKKKQIVIKEIK